MIITVNLHLRSNPLDEHHNLGLVAVEHDGTHLKPDHHIACVTGDCLVRAHVTSIDQQGDHLPHVFADEISAYALVD